MKNIVIGVVGQPNVGKTTVFNCLTGARQRVGNWPGKTIDRVSGSFVSNDICYQIVDIPGTYSLACGVAEEETACDFMINESPDVLVCVGDASSLERSLYFLSEVMCLYVPVVFAINMVDVAKRSGVLIDIKNLSNKLGMPVVPLVARNGEGVSDLKSAIVSLVENSISCQGAFTQQLPELSGIGGKLYNQIIECLNEDASVVGGVCDNLPASWIAAKILSGKSDEQDISHCCPLSKNKFSDNTLQCLSAILNSVDDVWIEFVGSRYKWVSSLVDSCVNYDEAGESSYTDRIDDIVLHPIWGMCVLSAVFALTFICTFYVTVSAQQWLSEVALVGLQDYAFRVLGMLPTNIMPSKVNELIVRGAIGGAGLVVTFLPVLVGMFTAIGFLEDTGYLARVAFIIDRFVNKIGLHGRGAIPLLLGCGCNVAAVVGLRIVENPRARIVAILLAPLVPCSARFVVLAFLVPVFFQNYAWLVAFSLVVLNVIVIAIIGSFLRATFLKDQVSLLVMELPRYHFPSVRTVGLFVSNNVVSFLKEAGTVIVLFSIILTALSIFPGEGLENSVLGMFARSIEPVGALLGFDWRMVIALISGVIARENVIASLSILYSVSNGNEAGLGSALRSQVSTPSALAFLVVLMLFVPCLPTVAAIKKETKSWYLTFIGVGGLLVIAFVGGFLTYNGATLCLENCLK